MHIKFVNKDYLLSVKITKHYVISLFSYQQAHINKTINFNVHYFMLNYVDWFKKYYLSKDIAKLRVTVLKLSFYNYIYYLKFTVINASMVSIFIYLHIYMF